jgi:iron complex outermembrane receptor protein
VGRTRNLGLELSLAQQLSAQWSANASYTYLNRTNLSDRRVTLVDTPRHRLFAAVSWLPGAQWELRATLEAEQGRSVNFDGAYRQLGGFGTAGLKAIYRPAKDVAVDFGVNNLADKWYELADGHPMPGRFWYVNGTYRF